MLLAVAVTSLLTGLLPVPVAAQTSEEERVFPEPVDSTDFITRCPEYAPEQFRRGMEELEARHGRYLEFTTIREELDEPPAVSVGEDGVPAWHADDTGDGLDFYVAALTDSESPAPDEDKGYVLFTVAHAGEWCAREAVPWFFEDLLRLAETAPDTVLEGGVGLDGEEVEITVGEALQRTKLLFVDVAPDGWVAGERNAVTLGPVGVQRQYSQSNGAGVNSNRVAGSAAQLLLAGPAQVLRGDHRSVAGRGSSSGCRIILEGPDPEMRGAAVMTRRVARSTALPRARTDEGD